MPKSLLLGVLLSACDPQVRPRADGGTEWQLPDGGWRGAGDGCSCVDEFNDELLEHGHQVVLRCELTTQCDREGCVPEVCFGDHCCVWRAP